MPAAQASANSGVDHDEFEQFYRRYASPLYLFALRFGNQREEAGEIVQDVMIAAFQQWPEVQRHEDPKRWIFMVAKRRIIDRYRQTNRTIPFAHETLREHMDATTLPNGLDVVVANDLVRRTMQRLPRGQRQVLTLSMEGYTIAEIASKLGTTRAAVSRRLYRARQNARDEVEVLNAEATEDSRSDPVDLPDAETAYLSAELLASLAKMMTHNFTDLERRIAFMAWEWGWSSAEIADELHTTIHVVDSHKARARRKIGKWVKQSGAAIAVVDGPGSGQPPLQMPQERLDPKNAPVERSKTTSPGPDAEPKLADVVTEWLTEQVSTSGHNEQQAASRSRVDLKGSPASSTGAELEAAVAAASGGDRSALAQVIELIRPLVVGYCRARIGTTGRGQLSADDVAQEVCLAVLTALPRYRDQGRPFMAYVYGIASHKVAEAHRAAAARQRDDLAAQPAEQVARQTLSDPAAMDELLTPLPEKDRQILILRLVMGLSAEETAMAIGSTVGVVRVAQHRSLARLKSQVAQASEPTDSDHVIRARESGARQEAGPQL